MSYRCLFLLLAIVIPGIASASDGQKLDAGAVIRELVASGDSALEAYQPDAGMDTMDRFSALYFDVFEGKGLETAVGMKAPSLKTRVESRFGEVIGLAAQGVPKEQVADAWSKLRAALTTDVAALFGSEDLSFTGLVLQSFLILLREGFEAMLVVMALAAYLRRSAGGRGMSSLYAGVGVALVASVLTAYGMKILFDVSGPGKEVLEGVTMLFAAAVLLYVSHWLLAKRQSDKWQAYIRRKVDSALSKGQLWALALAVFLAVYREGAETILFYYALAGQAENAALPMLLGSSGAAAALVATFLIMRTASLRLPLPLFFSATAALLFYLAFSFAGTGILELQEAGWVDITPLPGIPRLTWLGVYPTIETLLAQAVVLLPLIGSGIWLWFRRRVPAQA